MKTVVCVGTGGVGKTSVAAAMAWSAARQGEKVLAVTIDPARRLRTLLGIDGSRGEHRVGLEFRGELWAALLDVEHVLDEAVRLHGRGSQVQRVLSHPIYRMLTSSLSGMQELMAVEYLHQMAGQGFDRVVVDTAPSRHAFEFLDKPGRFAELVDLPLVKLVGRSYRFFANSPLGYLGRRSFDAFARLEDLVGARVVGDVLDFYSAFRTIAEGYGARAKGTVAGLRDPRFSEFWVVTTPGKAVRDVDFFARELTGRHFPVIGVIVNRALPGFSPEAFKPANPELKDWYLGLRAEQEQAFETLSRNHPRVLVEAVTEMPASLQGKELIEKMALEVPIR